MCHISRTRVVYPSHTQQFSHEIYKFAVFSCYHYSLFYFKQVCTNRCVHTIFICRLSLFIVCYFSYQDLILSLDLCTELLFLFHYSQTCGLYTYHGSYSQSVCLHQMLFNSICITLTVLLMSICTTVCCTITIVFVWLLPSGTTASEVRYYYCIGC